MTTDVGAQHDAVNSLALQPDGKIVAAGVADNGPAANFVVARYDTSGTLDPGFGIGGKVFTDFGGSDGAADVALKPDGKIVAAGGDHAHRDRALQRQRDAGRALRRERHHRDRLRRLRRGGGGGRGAAT